VRLIEPVVDRLNHGLVRESPAMEQLLGDPSDFLPSYIDQVATPEEQVFQKSLKRLGFMEVAGEIHRAMIVIMVGASVRPPAEKLLFCDLAGEECDDLLFGL
jgi:hypothetical protein